MRLELMTYRLGGDRSIHLSYSPKIGLPRVTIWIIPGAIQIGDALVPSRVIAVAMQKLWQRRVRQPSLTRRSSHC
jgi:hypothetical protein